MSKLWTDDDDRVTYRFSYDDEDRSFNTTFRIEEGEVWGEVLTHFLDFLSGVYGYDIKKFVDYNSNPCNLPVELVDTENES
jgi:hypothetical protein